MAFYNSCLSQLLHDSFVKLIMCLLRTKKRLQADPAAPGAPPLAVVCKNINKSGERHKDVYQYDVLGGLHGANARQALLIEQPGVEAYSRVLCIVYCGLTDEEALRLASRNNMNGHYNHKMTPRDYVSIACV